MKRFVQRVRCNCEAFPFCEHARNASKDRFSIEPTMEGWHVVGLEIADKNNVFVASVEGELKHPLEQRILTLIAEAPRLLMALELAESFMAGFEDDEVQEGINSQLATIRATIREAKGLQS